MIRFKLDDADEMHNPKGSIGVLYTVYTKK